MRILSRRDIISALVTGLTTGVIAWRIFEFLGTSLPFAPVLLVVIVPILWLAGVQLGYALAVVIKPFDQFGKFAAIGFTNAAVDFGILYLGIGLSGHASGVWYSVFKVASFSVAGTHSYFWNKHWAFQARGGNSQVIRFASVLLAALVVNVAISSIVVAFPSPGVSPAAWAGLSAVVGSAISLMFTFFGFRAFVFQKY